MPVAGLSRFLHAVRVDEPVLGVTDRRRVVERLVEDPYRLHLLVRREVGAPENQDLMDLELAAQRLRGGVVDATGQINTFDLGSDTGPGAVNGVLLHGGGHVLTSLLFHDR